MIDVARPSAALVAALRSATDVVVLTGAGVSAESGVPTFRDALTGLWAQYDPRELATPDAFQRNPQLVWDWYAARRAQVALAEPNPGHVALARLEALIPRFLLVTQNVDGLHARAGSRRLVELHGNIARVRCSKEPRVIAIAEVDSASRPPRCPHCGAYLRPDVVWFEEALPAAAIAQAEAASKGCDLFVVVGTSAEVYPAAALPQQAKAHGARLVEINPQITPITAIADDVLRAPAGIALPALVDAAFSAH